MFFVDIERIQFITIMTVAAFILVYAKVPPILVLIFVVLSGSILYKNNVINEANTLFYNSRSQHQQPSIKVAQDHIITAEIITLVNTKNRLSFDVKVVKINNTLPSFLEPKLELKWFNPDYDYSGEVGIGQVWRFKVRLSNTKRSSLLSRHIRYAGIITKGEIIEPQFSLRGDLYQVFKSVLPANPNPMLYALTFGDRSYISTALWTQFKLLGIGHLVAISGLHIGLIFGFCYLCIQRLLRLFKTPYNLAICLSISLVAAIFYAWIAGFSLPALRAIILLSLHCLYRIQYFKVTLLQLFSSMLLVTLVLDPLTVFAISFWLSFSAMAAVFVVVWLNHKQSQQTLNHIIIVSGQGEVVDLLYRVKLAVQISMNKVAYLCHSQILLTLLMLPIQVTVFSGFSLLSVLVNLIFIPIFSVFVLPVLLMAVVLLVIAPSVSRILIGVVNYLLNNIQGIWIRLTANDVVWVAFGGVSNGVLLNSLLLLFILLICSVIFKPMRVTFHSLSLLLLPIIGYNYLN
ncbi:competence protein ComEC [Moritella sp. Urea-trap-13]|nr:competence protein ComEC [Moritella sp. Urea-trap-13]